MDELIAELHGTGPTADLTALGLLPLFNQMATVHGEFETLMADKNATDGGTLLPTLGQHWPSLERQINLLLANLAEWQALATTPALDEAIGKIDGVILQIATPALARRTKAKSDAQPAPVA